jgi:CBS domain-containing protein
MERIGRTSRRKFLVVDDRQLAGVVSLSDLVSFLAVSKSLYASAASTR